MFVEQLLSPQSIKQIKLVRASKSILDVLLYLLSIIISVFFVFVDILGGCYID